MMSEILILSDHAVFSQRKASIQFIAEALGRAGHEVRFVTTSFSLSWMVKGDHRRNIFRRDGSVCRRGNIYGMLPLRLFHFQNWRNGLLNTIFEHSLYRWEQDRFGRVLKKIMPAGYAPDIVIMESGLGVAYYKSIRNEYARSRFIYWVNDNPKTIRAHPVTLRADRDLAATETVVIVSEAMRSEYPGAVHIEHGIDKETLTREFTTPYVQDGRSKIVCVGAMLYAEHVVHGAAELLPECDFFVIGPSPRKAPKNVFYIGEVAFADTVQYIQHADVGLAPYKETQGVNYISTSSLKIVQYMLLGLPIVCPFFAIREGGAGFFGYQSSDSEGMAKAIKQAIGCGRVERTLPVESWDSVVSRLVSLVEIDS